MSPEFPFPAHSDPPGEPRAPDFFVYGAPRCGTTTLQRTLALHPDIWLPDHKEPGYLAFASEEGHPAPHVPGYYATAWPQYLRAFERHGGARRVGEATPFYLALPRSVDTLRHRMPEARLLISLRDPVERALSHFRFHQRKGIGKADFMAAWENKGDLQPGGWSQGWALREFGKYGEQLRQLLDAWPVDQVHWFTLQDLKQRRQETYDGIFRFLDLDDFQVPPAVAMNQGGEVREGWKRFHESDHWTKRAVKAVLPDRWTDALWRASHDRVYRKPALPKRIEARLRRFYDEDVALLQDLTGMDLQRWRA